MATTNFTTTLRVNQTPNEAFNAVNQPQNWWSGEIEGSSLKLNDEFTYRYKDFHMSRQRVVEMIPDQKVVWLVTDSQINYTEDINEWTGTKISFEIMEKGGKTELRFSHLGLVPEIECFDSCSGAWTQLIQIGLFSSITTGKGEKIDLG
jgi:hypothetical protein